MDAKFHPVIEAMRAGDVEKLKALVVADPSLVTSRSSSSHPTLLQAVVLDGKDKPKNVEMVQVLIDAGAELSEPLVAAASIDNRAAVELLLDHGAAIDGTGGWSPLEEALYWIVGTYYRCCSNGVRKCRTCALLRHLVVPI